MTERSKPVGRTGEFRYQEALEQAAEAFIDGPGAIPVRPGYYPEPGSFHAELKKAEGAYRAFASSSAEMINTVRLGRRLSLEPVHGSLVAMVESIIRHPDPMVWWSRVYVPKRYLIGRSQRCSVLAAAIGRTLGFPEPHLERLAWSGLLSQIGKTRIPHQLMEKREQLTPEELARVREFVTIGVELLRTVPGISESIVQAVRCHHERLDGSGYPEGLAGDGIPVLARIIGTVDWFDAMTSVKPYTDNVLSSTDALDLLHRQRNVLFQDQIVEAFVRTVGLYPTGSLVELTTGEIALVAAQHPNQRTEPEVLIVLDEAQRPLETLERVDLRDFNRRGHDRTRTVKRALSSGELGLDAQEIMARFGQRRRGWRRFFGGS